jgi:hypothetical protein
LHAKLYCIVASFCIFANYSDGFDLPWLVLQQAFFVGIGKVNKIPYPCIAHHHNV